MSPQPHVLQLCLSQLLILHNSASVSLCVSWALCSPAARCFACSETHFAWHYFNQTDSLPVLCFIILCIRAWRTFTLSVNFIFAHWSFLSSEHRQFDLILSLKSFRRFLFRYIFVLFHRQGARLQSTLHAVSRGHRFPPPARTSAGTNILISYRQWCHLCPKWYKHPRAIHLSIFQSIAAWEL